MAPPPPPEFYYDLKTNFLRRLWRLVFPMLFGPSDGLPGGGGGLQGGGGYNDNHFVISSFRHLRLSPPPPRHPALRRQILLYPATTSNSPSPTNLHPIPQPSAHPQQPLIALKNVEVPTTLTALDKSDQIVTNFRQHANTTKRHQPSTNLKKPPQLPSPILTNLKAPSTAPHHPPPPLNNGHPSFTALHDTPQSLSQNVSQTGRGWQRHSWRVHAAVGSTKTSRVQRYKHYSVHRVTTASQPRVISSVCHFVIWGGVEVRGRPPPPYYPTLGC